MRENRGLAASAEGSGACSTARGMRRAVLALCVGVLPGLLGCGGVVERKSSRQSTDPAGSAGKSGSPPSSGYDPFGDASTALGECVLGPGEGTTGACDWVVEGRCYTEREMACNCACPHDRDSQCSSGFERGPTGHVAVDCF